MDLLEVGGAVGNDFLDEFRLGLGDKGVHGVIIALGIFVLEIGNAYVLVLAVLVAEVHSLDEFHERVKPIVQYHVFVLL